MKSVDSEGKKRFDNKSLLVLFKKIDIQVNRIEYGDNSEGTKYCEVDKLTLQ